MKRMISGVKGLFVINQCGESIICIDNMDGNHSNGLWEKGERRTCWRRDCI